MIPSPLPNCKCGYCLHGPLNRTRCYACMKRRAAQAANSKKMYSPPRPPRRTETSFMLFQPALRAPKQKMLREIHDTASQNYARSSVFRESNSKQSATRRLEAAPMESCFGAGSWRADARRPTYSLNKVDLRQNTNCSSPFAPISVNRRDRIR